MAGPPVYVYGYARTPFGRYAGGLAGWDSSELGAAAIDATLDRTGVSPERIDAAFVGVGMIGAAQLTPARQAVLRSRLPQQTPSVAVDRACCSGMSAIAAARTELASGELRSALAGGVEVLSRIPWLLARTRSPQVGAPAVEDPLVLHSPFSDTTIAAYTSQEALRSGVDRAQQDAWALRSHERWHAAHAAGYFAEECFAIERRPRGRSEGPQVDRDESPRADTTLEALARLPTVRGSETITAGNAPGLSDGAGFLLLGTADFGREHALRPLAEIVAHVRVAEGPTSGTRTPAIAIERALARAALALDDVALFEINEAFAATPLVSTLVLAGGDAARAELLRERTNVHGGAVALGHPLGASGARITMTLINGLRRRGGGLGVAAICGGYGQGEALVLRAD
jgi:acetyl-CoA C-acetyltransferase